MPTYWFDVFTPKTWQEAKVHGFTVSGFSESKKATVTKVQPGDFLICYLKGHTKLVGVLRVTGPAYFSHEPVIWAGNPFPARVPVEPIVALEPDDAIDFASLLPGLSFYDATNMRSTWARLQGSPTRLAEADGELLVAAIRGESQKDAPAAITPTPAAAIVPAAVIAPTVLVTPVPPVALQTALDGIIQQISDTQRDASRPVLFEQAVARAFGFLGFDVDLFGQAGRTDIVVNSPLGHDRFRAVVDAKSSGSGKIPEGQINWTAITAHRQHEGADFAVVVGEKFAGGNLTQFAANSSIALLDTESLMEIMRLHEATPFAAADLRPLFSTAGPVSTVVADLRQKSQTTASHWRLIADIVRLVDDFSRLEQPPVPTAGNLHAVLVARSLGSKHKAATTPSEQDVRDALVFLSCRAVGVLRPVEPDTAGYRLAMSRVAALQRLRALDHTFRALLHDPEEDLQPTTSAKSSH